jgi:hypothetical protein
VLINPAASIGNRHTFSDSVLGNKVMSFVPVFSTGSIGFVNARELFGTNIIYFNITLLSDRCLVGVLYTNCTHLRKTLSNLPLLRRHELPSVYTQLKSVFLYRNKLQLLLFLELILGSLANMQCVWL